MKKTFLFCCLLAFSTQIKSQVFLDYEITEADTIKSDTLFFDEIYNFYALEPERLTKINFSENWRKYFLPRIITGRNYLPKANEVNPVYSIWEDFGVLSLSDINFLNLDGAGKYTYADFRKIFFLNNIKNVFFYKYAEDFVGEKMRYFALEVSSVDTDWFVDVKELTEKMFIELNNTQVVFAHKIPN